MIPTAGMGETERLRLTAEAQVEVELHKQLGAVIDGPAINYNIMNLVAAGQSPIGYMVAFRLYTGSLRDMLMIQKNDATKASPELVQKVMQSVVTALEYMHSKGVCHLDVKPENVLILADGGDIVNASSASILCSRISAMLRQSGE